VRPEHESPARNPDSGARYLLTEKALTNKGAWRLPLPDNGIRRMPAEIYGWFTEGFDTADLRDSKALPGNWLYNAR